MIAATIRHLLLASGILSLSSAVFGQEQGVAPPRDTIFARKILMGSISTNMDELEAMTAEGGKLNLTEGQEHADIISVMLMSFPHMFPQSTNQWTPNADRDPAYDTYAAPEVWSNFADFYQRAGAASKIAFEASRAKSAKDFKTFVVQLREACNSCHAAYMKVDEEKPAQQ